MSHVVIRSIQAALPQQTMNGVDSAADTMLAWYNQQNKSHWFILQVLKIIFEICHGFII